MATINLQSSMSPGGQNHSSWKSLLNFTTKKHLLFLMPGLLFSCVSGATVPINAYLLGQIFASFTSYADKSTDVTTFKHKVVKFVSYVALNGAVSWITNWAAYSFWHVYGDMQAQSAYESLFNALLLKSMSWYDRRTEGASALSSRISFLVRELQAATALPLCLSVQYMATCLGCVILAFCMSWKLTLVVIAGLPFVAAIIPFVSRYFQKHNEAQAQCLVHASKLASSAIDRIEAVKCYAGEGESLASYQLCVHDAEHEYKREAFWHSLQSAIVRMSTLAMFVQGFWFGSVLLDKGQITSAEVVAAFWAAILAVQALINIMPHLLMLEKGRAAGHKLRVIIQSSASDESDNGNIETQLTDNFAGDVEFKSVCFTYPTRPTQLALDHVDLFFAAGETTFIVGKSGSGKSTIGQLLVRFYDPGQGSITLDGHDLSSSRLAGIRQKIMLVEQHSTLFTGSIQENIGLGSLQHSASMEEIEAAAEFAVIKYAVELMAAGFDTRLGTRGDTVSGGQRQRFALARAWLRDAPILILDESLSALDQVNRAAILNAIRKWRAGKTTIIITHDITPILPEDFVYVLDHGRVIHAGFRHAVQSQRGSMFSDYGEKVHSEQSRKSVNTNHKSTTNKIACAKQSFQPNPEDALEQSEYDEVLQLYLDQPTIESSRLSVFLPGMPRTAVDMPEQMVSRSSAVIAAPLWRLDAQTSMYSLVLPEHQPAKQLVGRNDQHHLEQDGKAAMSMDQPRSCHDDIPDNTGAESSQSGVPMVVETKPILEKSHVQDIKRSGYILKNPTRDVRSILATVWPCFDNREKYHIFVAAFACIIYAVSTPMFSYFFGRLLSTIYEDANRQTRARTFSLIILGVSIVDSVATYFMQFELALCGQIWINKLRAMCFKSVLSQPREFFDRDHNSTTRLIEILGSHAEMTQYLISRFAGSMLVIVVMTLTAVIWSFVICWKLTVVLFACSPLIYSISWATETAGGRLDSQVTSASEDSSILLAEAVTSITTVKALTLETYFRGRHRTASENALKLGVKRAIICGSLFGLAESSVMFLTALLFYYGSVLLAGGDYSLEAIFQVFALLLFSLSNVNVILCSLPQMSLSREAAHRVLRLARLPKECHEHQGATQISRVGQIRLDRVSFAYPSQSSNTVLDNINLEIPQGQCIALVGQSGSGKSTIASLLLKLYPTTVNMSELNSNDRTRHQGISISGTSIDRIDTGSLRFLIAMVSQKASIFPMTVAENITYGLKPESRLRDASNIVAAARAAGAHDFISSLPQGYGTLVGDGGTGLSGGQTQRIAVARALIRRPQVLVLDEVTSALDQESASLIRQTIRSLMEADRQTAEGARRMTIIIITHSREMMRVADSICVLEKGRVVQHGTFEDLISRVGAFQRLYRAQDIE